MRFLLIFLLFAVQIARAEIPDEFQAMVVEPAFSFTERLIDLTPAFDKSKQLNKPLLVYLGAADCPPCKEYTVFLRKHQQEMKAALSDVVLVDIRTWLTGAKLFFKIYDKKYTVEEFKTFVGDSNNELFYPSWWLLTSQGKQVRQLPHGMSIFSSVENHIRLIKGPYTQKQNAKRDISDFLKSTYGVVFTPSPIEKARWNCPEDRSAKPSGSTNRNWVCNRSDPSYQRLVVWSDDESRSLQIETDNFIAMAGGKDAKRGEASCVGERLSISSAATANIRDCKLPLPNGDFYVSFAHLKHAGSYLSFIVRNASPTGSTPKVASDLREWLAEIKFEQ
jgi:hypothetical protein